MMTKWDTIQEDVKDAYTYLDEEEAYNKAIEEDEDFLGHEMISIEDLAEQELALDWNE
jgi:hypothetical protein